MYVYFMLSVGNPSCPVFDYRMNPESIPVCKIETQKQVEFNWTVNLAVNRLIG